MVSVFKSPFEAVQKALKLGSLSKPIATAEESGPRTVLHDEVATYITPERLAGVLREAVGGDPAEFFILAEEMEERDGHYGSVIATRKLALLGIEAEIQAASEDSRDVEIAEQVREDILDNPTFGLMLGDLLDAIGKGVSAIEISWNTDNPSRVVPETFERVDPRWLTFDKKTRREVRLKEANLPEGVELQPWRYLVHRPQIKSGLPIRGGLARLAVWSWILKSYTIKDWAAFCEIFGQPLRLGKYGKGANDKDKKALLRAVRSIARDAAAIIPDSMQMELIQAKTSGGPVFKDFAEYLDGAMSKAVLGQTMTTDDGSSLAQAEVHDKVRSDILKADGRQLSLTINRDLIIPYCLINFGQLDGFPRFKLEPDEPEDLDLESKVLERLHKVGVRLSARQVRDKFGYDEPSEKEETIGGAPERSDETKIGDDKGDEEDEEKDKPDKKALNREHHDHGSEDEYLAEIMVDALKDYRLQGDPMLEPIHNLLENSDSLETFAAGLDSLFADQDMGPLTDAIAAATLKARALGDGKSDG